MLKVTSYNLIWKNVSQMLYYVKSTTDTIIVSNIFKIAINNYIMFTFILHTLCTF